MQFYLAIALTIIGLANIALFFVMKTDKQRRRRRRAELAPFEPLPPTSLAVSRRPLPIPTPPADLEPRPDLEPTTPMFLLPPQLLSQAGR